MNIRNIALGSLAVFVLIVPVFAGSTKKVIKSSTELYPRASGISCVESGDTTTGSLNFLFKLKKDFDRLEVTVVRYGPSDMIKKAKSFKAPKAKVELENSKWLGKIVHLDYDFDGCLSSFPRIITVTAYKGKQKEVLLQIALSSLVQIDKNRYTGDLLVKQAGKVYALKGNILVQAHPNSFRHLIGQQFQRVRSYTAYAKVVYPKLK